MKNIKKPIAFTMAAALSAMQMMVCYAPIEVYAADQGILTATSTKETVTGSDTFTVTVSLADNPGFRGLQFSVGYDENTFVVDGDPVASNELGTDLNVAKDQSKNDTPVYAVMATNTKLTGNTTANGTAVTINFKLKDSAVNGEYSFPITGIKAQKADNTLATVVSGTELKVKVTGNKANYTGATPAAPTVSNIKAKTFDVTVPAANEYTYSTAPITDFSTATWYKSTESSVTGLTPNTKYYVYQRVAETDDVKASPVSVAAEATTTKLTVDDVIASVSIGDEATAGAVLTPVVTYKTGYTAADAGTLTYTFVVGGISGEAPSYTVTPADVTAANKIKVTLTASNLTGTVDSNELTAGKKKNTGVPVAPAVTPTADGCTIEAATGHEYYVSDTNTLPASAVWAPAAPVTGKTPNSKFYVWSRIAATDVMEASAPSASVEVRVLNNDADLSALTVPGANISPAFSADVTDYTVSLPVDVSVPPAVSFTAKDANATAALTKTASDVTTNNVSEITVTAENKTATKVYKVTYQQITAMLNDLKVNGATVAGFDPVTLSYAVKVPYSEWKADPAKTYSVTATAAGTGTVTVDNPSVTLTSTDSDTASENPVKVSVSDETGTTVYTVNFVVEACAHKWDEGVITTPATSISNGKKTYTCSECGKTKTEIIPMLSADWDEGVITVKPTCTTDGVKTFSDRNSTQTYTEVIPATGHNWDEGVVTTPATATTTGIKTYTCKNCGEKKTEIIPATGGSSETTPAQTTNVNVSPNITVYSDPSSGANAIPAYGPITSSPTPSPVSPVINTSVNTNVNNPVTVKPAASTDADLGDGSAVIDEDIVVTADLSEIDVEVGKDGNATLTWGAVDGASSYTVYVYKNGGYKKYKTTKDTSVVLKGLKNNKDYKVLVRFKANGKLSDVNDSYQIEFKNYYKPDVKATAKKNSVVLKWDAVPGATEYAVYQVNGSKFNKLGSTDKTSFKVSDLKSGKTHKFIVRAKVDGSWTKASKADIVTAKTTK